MSDSPLKGNSLEWNITPASTILSMADVHYIVVPGFCLSKGNCLQGLHIYGNTPALFSASILAV